MRRAFIPLALILFLASALPGLAADYATGSHLTVWFAFSGYLYDPVNEIPSSIPVGTVITIDAGSALTAGSYTVDQVQPNYDVQHGGGLHTMVHVTASPGPNSATGGVWHIAASSSLYTLPTPTPNPAVHGTLPGVLLGDSITFNQGGQFGALLQTTFPNATVSTINDGVGGSATKDWVPGTANFNKAVQDAQQAGAKWAHIMLGSNDDAISSPTPDAVYVQRLQAIVDGLYSNISTLRAVVIEQPPCIVPGTYAQLTAQSNVYLRGFDNDCAQVKRVTVGGGLFDFFSAHGDLLYDGLHPNAEGQVAQVSYWAAATAPVLSSLPAVQPSVSDSFTPDPGPFSGMLTTIGNFIQLLINRYGVPATLIGIAVVGWLFVRRLAKSGQH